MSGKELSIRFTACAFSKLLSTYVFSYFSFGFEGRAWDLIVSIPGHCLSFYFEYVLFYQFCLKIITFFDQEKFSTAPLLYVDVETFGRKLRKNDVKTSNMM